ncbi:MAG: DNA polymerase III subunit delta' [Gammaproteobacteria bacterium]|nr:DNA polymerase III subunit delta' [Gammaproteobacteria bacterium]
MAVTAFQPYPWQLGYWNKLQQRRARGSLPHGLLLEGPEGLGKAEFAVAFAASLLCRAPDSQGRACNQCEACHLFKAHTHPDFKLIEPAEEGKAITVDQIREVVHYLSLSSHHGGVKVVVIQHAEAMNVNAANGLLKSLEEPPGNTVMMLVTGRPTGLLPTIRSRCQSILFALPERHLAKDWLTIHLPGDEDADLLLALANGAPLKALDFAQKKVLDCRSELLHSLEDALRPRADLLKVSKLWTETGWSITLYWLYSYVADMVRLKVSDQPSILNNPDSLERLQRLAAQLGVSGLLDFANSVIKAQRSLRGNANPRLTMDELVLAWRETYTQAHAK